MSGPAPAPQQVEVNGDVLIAQLVAMRALGLAMQQQAEAALAMLGVGPDREEVAKTAEDVLGGGIARPVFGAPQADRIGAPRQAPQT